jgi:hypothetical protein
LKYIVIDFGVNVLRVDEKAINIENACPNGREVWDFAHTLLIIMIREICCNRLPVFEAVEV